SVHALILCHHDSSLVVRHTACMAASTSFSTCRNRAGSTSLPDAPALSSTCSGRVAPTIAADTSDRRSTQASANCARLSPQLALGLAPQQRIMRLARHEAGDALHRDGGADLVGRPFREADMAHLALRDHLRQRLHGLFERRVWIVAVALIEIDMVGPQALQR